MAQDIKQKITLEGEKEYNQALKDAQRHLKTLRSELKAETAELGNNANAQDKNRVKSQNLQKQIKEQEKVVKTLKAALEEAKSEYGDNEEVVAKWETKLNDARTSLANMKNELDGLNTSIKDVNATTAAGVTATRSFAEAIEKLGEAGGNISGAIENTFMGVLGVVRDAVAELWTLVSETAAKANEWTDIAAIWNSDPATIERYARGVQAAGKSFSDLQAAVSKIATGDADKIWELTHVRFEGDYDEWEYAMQVLGNIAGMTSHSQQLETLSELFGDKRAAGIMDIINAWDTITSEGETLTSGGYGLGEGMLETMNEVQEKINGFWARWDALKEHVAGGLGEAVLPIMIDVQGAMDGFAAFLNAGTPEEQDEALRQIEENITKFFEDVAEAIRRGLEIIGRVGEELQESDDPITQTIGKALTTLQTTLEWLMDENNWSTIKTAVEAFFGLWLTGKAFMALSAIGSFAANMKTIAAFSAFKGLSGLFGGGSAAAGAAGTASSSGGGWLSGLLAGTGAKVVGGTLAGLGVLFENAIKPQGNDDILTAAEEAARNEQADVKWQRRKFEFNKAVEADGVSSRWVDNGTAVTDAQRTAAEAFWDAYRANPSDFSDDVWNAFESAFEGNEEVFDKLNEMIDLFVQSNNTEDQWRDVDNLPDWMFTDLNNQEGLTSSDLQGFRGLPAQIQAAARAGTAAGVSGIRVEMDGATVGRLVAPYVSTVIAADIV